ncbi:nucleoside hydrolase [Actinoplanes sp. NPDC051633]|uniref:nucleoside hydrolase n=1 Tax=Actinoplanes sp. NPDC051633 TaxID=3155670 RepID=UPI0034163C82
MPDITERQDPLRASSAHTNQRSRTLVLGWPDDRAARAVPAEPSPASEDLIGRARSSSPDEPLHVLAIGAPTNVAAALPAAPDIAERVVVVWLGGNPRYWHKAVEFNVSQDMAASRVLIPRPLRQVEGAVGSGRGGPAGERGVGPDRGRAQSTAHRRRHWSHDPTRHMIREALWADRDAIFGDLFQKLRGPA